MPRVVIEWTIGTSQRRAANVLNMTAFASGTGPEITAQAVADTILTTTLLQGVSNAAVVTAIEVSDPIVQTTWTGSKPGNYNAQATPPNASYLITKQGGPRRRHGRMYLPGVVENLVDNNGNLDAALLADLDSGVQAWFNALTANEWNIRQGFPLAPTEPAIVTGLSASPLVATQRRRLRS